jgi:hypothetical protein
VQYCGVSFVDQWQTEQRDKVGIGENHDAGDTAREPEK